ncbi:MAG TPA: Asp-tRNA(Asn)/Glu-tRNA(Gln) amidotransferase subunit GatB [Candidatus Nanoarchaeia archaeon]|nr:Asp-tRNA(Asn)/Glu-tRNA(Gln) amidotransferase subunit GatB [Candidatus Nanoarchaeia archaeon]
MAKIGLEVHVYVQASQKLFCVCAIAPNVKPNTTICPICSAQPGAKPMLPNKEAVHKVIKTAAMLNCKINNELVWQRKHYDWPDLPKGYQNTISGSYAVPVGEHGTFLDIGIRECHLEEDPARWDPETGCIDYNRSGYPLIEIVTEPDFKGADEVKQWLKKLMTTLSYINAVNRDMGVKCDVNVSIPPLFCRVEIKNVNSFRSIASSINYEIIRQQKEKHIEQHTRQWNETEQLTKFMRSKEQALDYMFIPDPDLPAVEINKSLLTKISAELPEKPEYKLKKLLKAGVEKTTAEVIATDLPLSELFERLSKKIKPAVVANWIRKDLLRIMDDDFNALNISEKHIEELLTLLHTGKITEQVGRSILMELLKKPFSPNEYVKTKNLATIAGSSELEKLCTEAIKNNPKPVEDYKSGNEEALNFLVGQVMRASKGKAKPQEVKTILTNLISTP